MLKMHVKVVEHKPDILLLPGLSSTFIEEGYSSEKGCKDLTIFQLTALEWRAEPQLFPMFSLLSTTLCPLSCSMTVLLNNQSDNREASDLVSFSH